MKKIELNELIRTAATRCVWFEPPEKAVAIPERLAAYILTYGGIEDVRALREQFDNNDIRDALDAAPPGIFDKRSWAYWNLMVGRFETPPLPQRRFS